LASEFAESIVGLTPFKSRLTVFESQLRLGFVGRAYAKHFDLGAKASKVLGFGNDFLRPQRNPKFQNRNAKQTPNPKFQSERVCRGIFSKRQPRGIQLAAGEIIEPNVDGNGLSFDPRFANENQNRKQKYAYRPGTLLSKVTLHHFLQDRRLGNFASTILGIVEPIFVCAAKNAKNVVFCTIHVELATAPLFSTSGFVSS